MVIKSIGQKSSGSFGRLLSYVTRDPAVMKDAAGLPIILKYNISGINLSEYKKAFEENEANRRYKRKGVNVSYHDILSFHPKDSAQLNLAVLEDLAREYLRLRNEACLAVGTYHTDKEHRHIHLVISGVEYGSGKAIRVSVERFREIREALQTYQEKHYPELVSVVAFGKQERGKSDEEYHLEARNGKQTCKEELKQSLQLAFEKSLSPDDFYKQVAKQGLVLYERNETVTGIEDNRRYRFETLGIDNEKMKELRERSKRMESLETVRGEVRVKEATKEEERMSKKDNEELDVEQ
jgi:hypothetical protein